MHHTTTFSFSLISLGNFARRRTPLFWVVHNLLWRWLTWPVSSSWWLESDRVPCHHLLLRASFLAMSSSPCSPAEWCEPGWDRVLLWRKRCSLSLWLLWWKVWLATGVPGCTWGTVPARTRFCPRHASVRSSWSAPMAGGSCGLVFPVMLNLEPVS
jgi:hypothetical protein